MKQFNLDEYLKNPTRPVVTRGGNSVRIICTDRKFEFSNAQYPVIALIKDLNGNECVIGFTSDGKEECDYDDNTDLFFISEDRIPIKKFNLKEFQPFDRVLLRDRGNFKWLPSFLKELDKNPLANYLQLNLLVGVDGKCVFHIMMKRSICSELKMIVLITINGGRNKSWTDTKYVSYVKIFTDSIFWS